MEQLNKRYSEIIQKADKDQVSNLRQAQRTWIKHRDEGAKLYVSLFINLKIYGSSVIADYLGEFAGLGM